MTTTAEKAADLLDIIAEDPATVQPYRRSPGAASETALATFTGRIDPVSTRVAMEDISTLGAFTRQSYALVYATSGPDLRLKDELRVTWADGRAMTFRVMSFLNAGWKKQAVLEKVE